MSGAVRLTPQPEYGKRRQPSQPQSLVSALRMERNGLNSLGVGGRLPCARGGGGAHRCCEGTSSLTSRYDLYSSSMLMVPFDARSNTSGVPLTEMQDLPVGDDPCGHATHCDPPSVTATPSGTPARWHTAWQRTARAMGAPRPDVSMRCIRKASGLSRPVQCLQEVVALFDECLPGARMLQQVQVEAWVDSYLRP